MSLSKALGPPSHPGDAEQSAWATQTMERLLESIIRLTNEIRCARVKESFSDIAPEISLMA